MTHQFTTLLSHIRGAAAHHVRQLTHGETLTLQAQAEEMVDPGDLETFSTWEILGFENGETTGFEWAKMELEPVGCTTLSCNQRSTERSCPQVQAAGNSEEWSMS